MKRILIINGNPNIENIRFDDYCASLRDALAINENDVKTITFHCEDSIKTY